MNAVAQLPLLSRYDGGVLIDPLHIAGIYLDGWCSLAHSPLTLWPSSSRSQNGPLSELSPTRLSTIATTAGPIEAPL